MSSRIVRVVDRTGFTLAINTACNRLVHTLQSGGGCPQRKFPRHKVSTSRSRFEKLFVAKRLPDCVCQVFNRILLEEEHSVVSTGYWKDSTRRGQHNRTGIHQRIDSSDRKHLTAGR